MFLDPGSVNVGTAKLKQQQKLIRKQIQKIEHFCRVSFQTGTTSNGNGIPSLQSGFYYYNSGLGLNCKDHTNPPTPTPGQIRHKHAKKGKASLSFFHPFQSQSRQWRQYSARERREVVAEEKTVVT